MIASFELFRDIGYHVIKEPIPVKIYRLENIDISLTGRPYHGKGWAPSLF